MEKRDILSMSFEELTAAVKELGEPAFRAKQIYSWLHVSCVTSFDDMTNISKALRQKLNDNFVIFTVSIEKKLISEYDYTQKYLYKLHDGEFIESVLMKYKYGYTICVSTQVGCRMGCKFCASTLDGVVRNLTASEILSQVYEAQRDNDIKISHVVLMGMGEPLDNYDNVMRFLSLITDENGQNMSMRHISLSTCGVVPKIYDLMEKDLQLTLSVSLHAPDDEIRSSMMPVNRKWSIDELLTACKKYTDTTRRRISFEYAMVSGVNDSDDCARLLARKLRGILCHVNLIPVNEVKETGCKKSSRERIESFSAILEKNGYAVTVRRKLGSDINASCGQLRRSSKKEE
ncbi:MAG: 23S rRNA (adenine(2503)-C(2))-methyltransferase RlmN [Clostridia bacterium]|nr:23S rRNA (adenine(2503)-C(2))-methyltransferase RlmN [Clostridia bacterium]MBQ8503460.1 23S rRNA (adenine(2503)-C(2))-methyltransferase RlmN [Clostridia bacterium]